ncbi:hypothetical protein PGT21_037136 [Puccinia graminis f. sp. tritici]|uniref:Uncharacterized protein n=1 Tax=Puccinia graminis f. sp. tritici TaxID=56615 RepID=A0A5B0M718_PUCGR|nr:hypothetical protein PGTUg99_008830 [Puccinia graminis f. sp. tritici]KAA1084661.1 hypothetical protein PGT21_033740 [Puccinia graminis f. sp. tritici]KAA1120087.1 hypothetical protein PGT21_037136 [Puccinia graminis f. sp. tritici]
MLDPVGECGSDFGSSGGQKGARGFRRRERVERIVDHRLARPVPAGPPKTPAPHLGLAMFKLSAYTYRLM